MIPRVRRAVLVILLLAGCSSSSKPAARPTPSLHSSVDAYTKAFGDGNGRAAWSIVSKRCRGVVDETEYRAIVAAAGVKYRGLHLTRYSESIDGSAATVDYSTTSTDLTYDDQRWVLESGLWRWDGC